MSEKNMADKGGISLCTISALKVEHRGQLTIFSSLNETRGMASMQTRSDAGQPHRASWQGNFR